MLPHELSGGMRMRASLARAFVQQPHIMFLDEAFSALDALTRHAAWERFLERWRRTRPTVLLVTHDMDEAVLLADQVVVLGGTPLEVRARVLVDLPRPRRASHRHDPHLGHLVTQVEGWLS